MPNHVTNIVIAPTHVLKSLINDEGVIDFNMVVGFKGQFEWNGIRCDAESAAEFVTGNPLDDNPFIAALQKDNRSRINILKMDDLGFEQFVQMLRNKRKHGYFHNVDFARENWGTKWNAYSQTINLDDGFIKFDTAWSCPTKLLKELSNKHPNIDITVKYADEDIGSNCGTLIIKDGNVITQNCAGHWPDMDKSEQDKWKDFAYEVTGIEREDNDED